MGRWAFGTVLALGLALASAVARADDVTSLAAGDEHTCAVTASGAVQCWGRNTEGQLGDGTTTWRPAPVPVSGLSVRGTAVAAGLSSLHTCALTVTGGVKCWGSNIRGQLGNGTTNSSPFRVQVSGLTGGVVEVAVGSEHSCALTSAGAVLCWGANGFGQLGDGTSVQRDTPVPVWGLPSGVASISAGAVHTCAVTTAGGVMCWGYGSQGQLGSLTEWASEVPIPVDGLSGPVARVVAGGSHTCALGTSGDVECWGDNSEGQIGIGGTSVPVWQPTQVSGFASGATAISAAVAHTCALTAAGGVKCWGSNSHGQLGDGTTTTGVTPVAVAGLAGASAVAAGARHTCAVTGEDVRCWGRNGYGQLGIGESVWSGGVPVAVTGLSGGVASFALGETHSCALGSGGGVACWGQNVFGQLGNGTNLSSNVPVPVTGFAASGAAAIVSGLSHNCLLTTAGGVRCWGWGGEGRLGNGNTIISNVPATVARYESEPAVAIAAGDEHSCAVDADPLGVARCWGDGPFGQLGSTNTRSSTPVAVAGVTLAAAMAGGFGHSCALMQDQSVRCWGYNTAGQLGNGTITSSPVSTPVIGLSGPVVELASANLVTCALTAAGAVQCWGHNGLGQLGNGGVANSAVPVTVTGLSSGVVDISVGWRQVCAVTSAGGVLCWGLNTHGELGDGTTTLRRLPVAVAGLPGDVVNVVAGYAHTCAATAGGDAYCWGRADDGQLGNGLPLFYATPQTVLDFEVPEVPALGALGWAALAAALAATPLGVTRRRRARYR